MRLTRLEWHIIKIPFALGLMTGGIVWINNSPIISPHLSLYLSSMIPGALLLAIFWDHLRDDLKLILRFKYRIVGKNTYTPEVLTIGWFLIPTWEAVSTKSYSYKTQNIFGAKNRGYGSTDKWYKTKEKALEAIGFHKQARKYHLETLLERPKKEITYL